jgi:hypothetical protein
MPDILSNQARPVRRGRAIRRNRAMFLGRNSAYWIRIPQPNEVPAFGGILKIS